jgi:hypothetical protein
VQIVTHDRLRYSYDWLGRAFKTEVLKDDGTTVTRTEQATFDALGRAATVTNNLGSFTSTYAAGNLSAVPDSVALPGGYSSTYTRHPMSAATPANAALSQGNALRLASITHKDAANTTLQNHGYQYNADGEEVILAGVLGVADCAIATVTSRSRENAAETISDLRNVAGSIGNGMGNSAAEWITQKINE